MAKSHFLLLVLLLLGFTIVAFGVGVTPREFYRALAANPYVEQKAIHQQNYFQESPLLPILAHHLGFVSRTSFNFMCLGIVIGSFLVFAHQLKLRTGPVFALGLFILLQAHPVTIVLLSWLGMPDGLTFGLTVLSLFVTSPLWLAAICLAGALNHPIAVFCISSVILLRRLANDEGIAWRHVFVCVLALIAGTLVVRLFLHYLNISLYSRFDHATDQDMQFWIKHNFRFFFMTVYSFHNTAWFAILFCVLAGFAAKAPYFIVFALLQLAFYGITFFCLDTTRVFALLAWAPAMHCIMYAYRLCGAERSSHLSEQVRKFVLLVAVIGFFTPSYYVYLGEYFSPANNEFHLWPYVQSLFD